jgi:hypothetical protein
MDKFIGIRTETKRVWVKNNGEVIQYDRDGKRLDRSQTDNITDTKELIARLEFTVVMVSEGAICYAR